jgi:hypothetical protein
MTGDFFSVCFAQKYTDESGERFFRLYGIVILGNEATGSYYLPTHFRQVNYIDSRLFDKDISNISLPRLCVA